MLFFNVSYHHFVTFFKILYSYFVIFFKILYGYFVIFFKILIETREKRTDEFSSVLWIYSLCNCI